MDGQPWMVMVVVLTVNRRRDGTVMVSEILEDQDATRSDEQDNLIYLCDVLFYSDNILLELIIKNSWKHN